MARQNFALPAYQTIFRPMENSTAIRSWYPVIPSRHIPFRIPHSRIPHHLFHSPSPSSQLLRKIGGGAGSLSRSSPSD